MYLRRLEIENFMRLTAFNVDAQGQHVIISGQNGSGKTSVVESIWEALAGSNSKERPEPVHKGESKALIRLDLGDYLVEKHIAADGRGRLVVKAADGSKVTTPQKLLDGLLSQYCLDPVAFLDRRPQDQLDDVLKVCGVEPPIAAVEKITGEPAPVRPGESADQYLERLSGDEMGEWYRRRRELHRAVETAKGALEKQEKYVADLVDQSPEAAQARSTEAITGDLEAAVAAQAAYQDAKALVDKLAGERSTVAMKFETLQGQQTATEGRINQLEKQLEEQRAELATIKERLEKGRQVKLGLDRELEEARFGLGYYADQGPRIAELRKELAEQQGQQKAILEHESACRRLQDLSNEYESKKTEHQRADQVLTELRILRQGLLEGIDLGVSGLEVGQGELRLHGVTFKQASLAQRLRVAVAVAMKGQGQLKLIRIDDGEHLDLESRAYLLKLATEHGYQVVMTCVSNSRELGVEIVDREATVETAGKRPRGRLFADEKRSAVEAGY